MQGKTDKQYESGARIFIGAIVGIFLTVVGIFIADSCSGQEIGYHVVVVDYSAPTRLGDKVQTDDPKKVDEIFNKYFELDCFSILQETKETRSFQLENEKVWVYVEERAVIRKKNGKVKYKKIRGEKDEN